MVRIFLAGDQMPQPPAQPAQPALREAAIDVADDHVPQAFEQYLHGEQGFGLPAVGERRG